MVAAAVAVERNNEKAGTTRSCRLQRAFSCQPSGFLCGLSPRPRQRAHSYRDMIAAMLMSAATLLPYRCDGRSSRSALLATRYPLIHPRR